MNIGASLSGLFAAQTRFDVAANDLANASTDGYREARAELAAQEQHGGVRVEAITKPGDAAAPSDGPSNVSLAAEMTEVMAAQHTYGANAQVLRSIADLQGTLFDQRV